MQAHSQTGQGLRRYSGSEVNQVPPCLEWGAQGQPLTGAGSAQTPACQEVTGSLQHHTKPHFQGSRIAGNLYFLLCALLYFPDFSTINITLISKKKKNRLCIAGGTLSSCLIKATD